MSSAQDRWYFTREQLAASPSRGCGLDADKELAYRQQAANLIQDMGQRLQVTQLCINTAIVYMHRFYAFHSFTQFHRNAMAAAALFLAAKVEEQPRKLEHVIKVSHMCLHRDGQPNLDVNSKHYQEQTQDLVFNENVLLQTLGFDVAIDHPHTHVVRTCNLVKASKDLAQTSYFMASNSLHLTTMCLQYKPTVVACFCIHLASKWSNWAIPQSNEGKHWFYYVDRTVTSDLLEHLTAEFLHIFDRCPARLKRRIMSISNAQGTNSPQSLSSSSHNSNSIIPLSSSEKDLRKIPSEEFEKIELDKRQQGLFGPSTLSNSSNTVPTSNKMDYREYKERQQQQERRRPTLPPPNSLPRPQDIPSSSQTRQPSSSSSNTQRLSQNIPSQHRWPSNQRNKDPNQSMRPHPSQSSSSRPHHRNSTSVIQPQIPQQSQSMQSIPEHRTQRMQQSASQPLPSTHHSSRVHPQPQLPPPQPIQHPPLQPPQLSQQPIIQQPAIQQPQQTQQSQSIQQQPPVRTPSLFSPEPQRKPSVPIPPRRPHISIPPTKDIPAPLSPFSSSPPSISQINIEPDLISVTKKEEIIQIDISQIPVSTSSNTVETDPSVVSTLLKDSLPHRSEKKKKKEKHKHKDRDKREERRKHKKDKDKRRDSETNLNPVISVAPPIVPVQNTQPLISTPLKITIPKEAIASSIPPKLKIKIPKKHLKTEPPPVAQPPLPVQGLKIKLPKMVEGTKKRPADDMPMEMMSHKAPRLPQNSHPHKTLNNMVLGNGQSGNYK